MVFKPLFFGVVLPALVCAAVLVAAWCASGGRRRGDTDTIARWGAIIGVGLAYAVGHEALVRSIGLSVRDGLQWLGYGAVIIVVPGLIGACLRRLWVQMLLALLVITAATWLLIGGWMEPVWAWRVGFGVGAAVLWALLEWLARRRRGASMPIIMLLVAAGGGGVMVLAGLAQFGQLAGVLAAAIGPCVLLAWIRPQLTIGHGPVLVFTLILAALLLHGYHLYDVTAEFPPISFAIVLAAPVVAWVGELPPIVRLRAWQAVLVRVVAVMIPVGAALGMALRAQ